MQTNQEKTWNNEFGQKYTDRNLYDREELDAFYMKVWGISRTSMNEEFIGQLDKNARILEVGSNVGNQLVCLQTMGFRELYGIELQEYAVNLSKTRTRNINILQGSAFDLPFKDGYFDIVFTSGVLIHISPEDLKSAISEIVRCSRKLVWGFEYYNPTPVEIEYRGERGLLWKRDFAQAYLGYFPQLKMVREKKFKYLENDNVDQMFLLEKR